ncbi:MAG TPA: hypothetical protein VFV87_02285 [Pirellulaceae bacterium]|nr:hypothetical protein [Pirellulaceae bacterium]
MGRMELQPETLEQIQQLIVANFAGRDELYAAADTLDDGARRDVCRRLAEFLAGHAVELQQILKANGQAPAGPVAVDPIATAFFDSAQCSRGQVGVLAAAAERERDLKEGYQHALEKVSHPSAENVLRRHQKEVEFVEQVLRGMGAAEIEGQ